MSALRYIVLTSFFSFVSLLSFAQTAADLWCTIPSALTPYLTQNQRKEMIESNNIGVDTNTINQMNEKSRIDTLTADYGRFVLSDVKDMQLIVLRDATIESRAEYAGVDTVVCLITTVKGPAEKSMIQFYDKNWVALTPSTNISDFNVPDDFIVRPDTMNVERYDELKKLLEPSFVSLCYDISSKNIFVEISPILVSKQEKEDLKAIIRKRMLNTIGLKFN